MSTPILGTETHWVCPNCPYEAVTHYYGPHSHLHACPAMGNLSVPAVPAGTDCQVVALEREDGKRGIMAVRTEYADGSNDQIAFADSASPSSNAFSIG